MRKTGQPGNASKRPRKSWTPKHPKAENYGIHSPHYLNSGESGIDSQFISYEVHEKLQNFMVPVPTAGWHEEQIDELFANLLGRDVIGRREPETVIV